MKDTVLDIYGLAPVKIARSKQNPDKSTNEALIVGLELEIENLYEGQDWYQERAGSFWQVVEDRSLRPIGRAWEFISKPAPLGVALAELRIFFEKMKFTDRNYSDRCSVHVHTNVQDFTQEQLANVALVYPIFESPLFQFVNHYKKVEEQGYNRDTNLYCVPWSQCRMNRNFVQKFFDEPSALNARSERFGGRPAWQKYTALNFLPISEHGTIEWRHMHGTADMEKLTIWMNCIGAIMKFCKENDFSDIVKTIKVLNDVSTYSQFFSAVLDGALTYEEQYRGPMAEGVINAKYSLINWESNKDKPKAKKVPLKSFYDELVAFPEVAVQGEQPPAGGLAAAARRTAQAVRWEPAEEDRMDAWGIGDEQLQPPAEMEQAFNEIRQREAQLRAEQQARVNRIAEGIRAGAGGNPFDLRATVRAQQPQPAPVTRVQRRPR